ncbi:hypothetical protein EG359_00155 [Chryseobacterium joostei]|uniref:Uncharacterized protein n=1 Tax=Chryseobacterium joostei TaxID=112234 RepID=A0A1N7IEW2_9FLAO|nr:hypothetical protein [Chryseobacterium joostei]AZA98116.1 hypothetical protein EG359_00155 [Chryseobacterium joostei]SIS35580.1 hypothetical protein SAMN05421768_104416 [Chryseobacterium joostei]
MNITETLRKVVHSNNYWKHSDFLSVMETLSSHYDIDIEIDSEKIAVIVLENKTIGYTCLNYPMIFIENKYASQVRNVLHTFNDVEYIIVDMISHQYLSVDSDIYNSYFDYMENLNAFSAEDFYFYNVT